MMNGTVPTKASVIAARRGRVFRYVSRTSGPRASVFLFVTGNPNDAHSEAGRGVRLDEQVRSCRVDPRHDGLHRHSGVPSLDIRQQTAEVVASLSINRISKSAKRSWSSVT